MQAHWGRGGPTIGKVWQRLKGNEGNAELLALKRSEKSNQPSPGDVCTRFQHIGIGVHFGEKSKNGKWNEFARQGV